MPLQSGARRHRSKHITIKLAVFPRGFRDELQLFRLHLEFRPGLYQAVTTGIHLFHAEGATVALVPSWMLAAAIGWENTASIARSLGMLGTGIRSSLALPAHAATLHAAVRSAAVVAQG